jgi:hypothetical protein
VPGQAQLRGGKARPGHHWRHRLLVISHHSSVIRTFAARHTIALTLLLSTLVTPLAPRLNCALDTYSVSMDDIDSDDQDFGPAPTGRYSTAGKRSIAELADNALSDRLTSKKVARGLELTKRSPNLEYQMYLWHARFTAFRLGTLNIKK